MSEFIFKLPDLGEGTVEAEIAEWMVKVGDAVNQEDPICAMLTDKAAVELTAPVSGTVTSVAGEEGDMVSVGAPLIVFSTSAEVAEAADESSEAESDVTRDEATAAESVASTPSGAATGGKVLTSPSIRAQAREAGVDLSRVAGSGPRGRILKADLEKFMAGGAAASAAPATATAPAGGSRRTGTREIKVIGLRRKIAERMARATREIPHFTYVEEIDVTALESLREHLNAKKAEGEPRITPLAFIGLGLVKVLGQFPQCNATYDDERNIIVQHDAVHLGIATQTSDGLKVPVVRHAESFDLEGLAAEIRRVSAAARDNTAGRDELSGSTITITSLGKLGGVVSTPVINQPEVGIIGVNKAIERPVVVNGQLAVRTLMNLSSSFDHRFVDGFDAAAMIQQLKDCLEQPATLFMP